MNTTETTPAVWVDGDPLMEAIAAAVWQQCQTHGTSVVVDDPRNIAAVAATAIRRQPKQCGATSTVADTPVGPCARPVGHHEAYHRNAEGTAWFLGDGQLPPPSPGLVMHQAAARLRELAEPAQRDLDTSNYWACYDKATAWRDGFDNGFGGPCSGLVAAFTPAVALLLADWLDSAAYDAQQIGPDHHALALAEAVLATTPAAP